MSETRRAFVTGASGFVGKHLVEALLAEGWAVKAMDLRPDLPPHAGLTTLQGDITDGPLLEKEMAGTDVLFHLAAALGASLIGEGEFFRINAGGTEAVLEAAEKAGVRRVVHFSSAGVLGAVSPGEVAEEDYPTRPIDAYDRSKHAGEKIALERAGRWAETSGPEIVIIRPGWLYGPGDRRTLKLIRAILNRRFMLVTKGNALQTPCHIDDLVRGVLLAVAGGRNGEIYHITGAEVLTVRAICEAIAAAGGTRIPPVRLPLWPVRVAAWKLGLLFRLFKKEAPLTMGKLAFFIHPKPLAIDKARRELGFSPRTDFETGITRTIAWYRTHSWL